MGFSPVQPSYARSSLRCRSQHLLQNRASIPIDLGVSEYDFPMHWIGIGLISQRLLAFQPFTAAQKHVSRDSGIILWQRCIVLCRTNHLCVIMCLCHPLNELPLDYTCITLSGAEGRARHFGTKYSTLLYWLCNTIGTCAEQSRL